MPCPRPEGAGGQTAKDPLIPKAQRVPLIHNPQGTKGESPPTQWGRPSQPEGKGSNTPKGGLATLRDHPQCRLWER